MTDRGLTQPEPWVKTYCGGKPNYTTQPTGQENRQVAKNATSEWVGLSIAEFEQIEQLFGNKVSNDFVLADIICTVALMLKEKNT